jgi:hypothetical protein
MGRLSSVRAALFVIAFAFLFPAACGENSSHVGGASYKIAAATARSDYMHLAGAGGILQGQINGDGTASFWLGTSSGGQALSWPYGYSARDNPLAVYDDAGNRVAAVGQKVTMTGGLMADNVHSITGCSGFMEFFGVGQVDSAT